MDLLRRFELKAKKAAELVPFTLVYHPGLTEDEDKYEVVSAHKDLTIHCFGENEDQAYCSAVMEAEGQLMGDMTLADKIINDSKKKSSK
jgi:hypothetical protein